MLYLILFTNFITSTVKSGLEYKVSLTLLVFIDFIYMSPNFICSVILVIVPTSLTEIPAVTYFIISSLVIFLKLQSENNSQLFSCICNFGSDIGICNCVDVDCIDADGIDSDGTDLKLKYKIITKIIKATTAPPIFI